MAVAAAAGKRSEHRAAQAACMAPVHVCGCTGAHAWRVLRYPHTHEACNACGLRHACSMRRPHLRHAARYDRGVVHPAVAVKHRVQTAPLEQRPCGAGGGVRHPERQRAARRVAGAAGAADGERDVLAVRAPGHLQAARAGKRRALRGGARAIAAAAWGRAPGAAPQARAGPAPSSPSRRDRPPGGCPACACVMSRAACAMRHASTHIVDVAGGREAGDLARLVAGHHLVGANNREGGVVRHAAAAELRRVDAHACACAERGARSAGRGGRGGGRAAAASHRGAGGCGAQQPRANALEIQTRRACRRPPRAGPRGPTAPPPRRRATTSLF